MFNKVRSSKLANVGLAILALSALPLAAFAQAPPDPIAASALSLQQYILTTFSTVVPYVVPIIGLFIGWGLLRRFMKQATKG